MLNPMTPLGFLIAVLDVRVRRARSERGASAVEWVIIAAIVVGICIGIAAILRSALTDTANNIGDDIRNS